MYGPACLPIGTSDRSGLAATQPRKANGFKTIQKMSVAHDGGRILPRPDRPSHFSSPSAAAAASSFLLRFQRNQNVSSVFELDAVHNLFEDEKRHATIKNYPRNTCNARRVWNADYKEHHVDQLLACADSKEHRPARIIQAKQNVAIL